MVLTNAAGGIRAGYQVGQPVLIADHLNLTGRSPLAGSPPPEGYASRFTDLTDLYSARLRALARRADPDLAEGVYAAMPGPHYETPAEIRMLAHAGRRPGRDVHGARGHRRPAPRRRGARRSRWSATWRRGWPPSGLDHLEVVAAGQAAAGRMGSLLAGLLPVVVPGR